MGWHISTQSKLFAFLKWVKNASQWANRGRLAQPLQTSGEEGTAGHLYIGFKTTNKS